MCKETDEAKATKKGQDGPPDPPPPEPTPIPADPPPPVPAQSTPRSVIHAAASAPIPESPRSRQSGVREPVAEVPLTEKLQKRVEYYSESPDGSYSYSYTAGNGQ
jgi:hypothetical protein